MIITGIDPGQKGGIGFIDSDACTLEVLPMPIKKRKMSNGKYKTLVCEEGVAEIFADRHVDHVFLEEVWAKRGDGLTSAGNFMQGKGVLLGVLAAYRIPTSQMLPKVWQRAMNCPADPKKAVSRAIKLLPAAEKLFYGPRGGVRDGLAEGALMALYGCLCQNVPPKRPLELVENVGKGQL